MSACRIIGVTQIEKNNDHRGDDLSVHFHNSSHHELVHQPSHWDDDEEDGVCMRFFLLEVSSCNPLLFTLFDNLHGQRNTGCCFTGIVFPHLSSVIFVFFTTIQATFAIDLLLSFPWINDSFSCASSEVVAHQCPILLIWEWSMADSSTDLFDNSKLYEGPNDMRTFLNCHLGVLFL